MSTEYLPISRPSSLGLRDYAHVFPPPDAVPFDRGGQIINLAPGATGVITPDAIVDIPVQNIGVISQVAVLLSTYGATPGPTWSLLQGGSAMRDYTNRRFPLGALETPAIRHIKVLPRQPITIQFVNGGAVALTCAWIMYGWYYPSKR